jgi:hypothetical protein
LSISLELTCLFRRPEGEIFASQRELADLAAKWPGDRLVEVYNGIPGLAPIKKFTDRKSAVGRIWKAIQSLGDDNGSETSEPAKASATAAPKQAKKAKHAAKRVEKAKNVKNPKNAAKATTKTAKGRPGKAASKLATAHDGSKRPRCWACYSARAERRWRRS